MTAVSGGNNITADLWTTVSGTVECARRFGQTGKPALYRSRFPPVQDMERCVSPASELFGNGVEIAPCAHPFAAR